MKLNINTKSITRKSFLAVSALVFTAFLGVSCKSKTETPQTSGKIKATATIGMVADLVKQVGGDRVEVEQMMGPGVDPHLYKPTAKDAAIIGEITSEHIGKSIVETGIGGQRILDMLSGEQLPRIC
jgi:hypothetical protein